MKKCCSVFKEKVFIKRKRGENFNQKLILYEQDDRSFALAIPRKCPMQKQIYFCPWCGAKFPRSLEKEWSDMVDEVLQLKEEDTFGSDEYNKLPEKYRTEQWWRELGL
jgi:hypothetical protein